MTDDAAFRDALRDLIPDYTGPEDPLPRVIASVRRRRSRQRTLLAVGGAGLVVVLALAGPALLLPGHGGGGGVRAAAPYDPTAPKGAVPTVHPVAAGVVNGVDWAIGSATLATGARRCLLSDDDVSNLQVTCFDEWTPGAAVTWNATPLSDKGIRVTRITGVAPAGTAAVRVRVRGAATLTLPVKATATDRAARFFGVVLPGTVPVRDITALDAAGSALGPPVAAPGSVCRSGPDRVCAPPK
ncbi:MAG TPA: hypothetical protein VI357_22145 [Mycobacteriales bacterium]